MGDEREDPIRWPKDMDRASIDRRLAIVHAIALRESLEDLVARFENVSAQPAAVVRKGVLAALNSIMDKPRPERRRYYGVTQHLQLVAVNLKNL
jgi:hypothetical protein